MATMDSSRGITPTTPMYSLGLPAWSALGRPDDRELRTRRKARAAALTRRVELALCARRTLEDVEAEISAQARHR